MVAEYHRHGILSPEYQAGFERSESGAESTDSKLHYTQGHAEDHAHAHVCGEDVALRGAARRRGAAWRGARGAISGGRRRCGPSCRGRRAPRRPSRRAHRTLHMRLRHPRAGVRRAVGCAEGDAPASEPSCGHESHRLSLRAARRGERARRGGHAGAQGVSDLRSKRPWVDDISTASCRGRYIRRPDAWNILSAAGYHLDNVKSAG